MENERRKEGNGKEDKEKPQQEYVVAPIGHDAAHQAIHVIFDAEDNHKEHEVGDSVHDTGFDTHILVEDAKKLFRLSHLDVEVFHLICELIPLLLDLLRRFLSS